MIHPLPLVERRSPRRCCIFLAADRAALLCGFIRTTVPLTCFLAATRSAACAWEIETGCTAGATPQTSAKADGTINLNMMILPAATAPILAFGRKMAQAV